MHHNVFTIVAALAAACVFCWLAILNFRGDFKNPQSQATHVSTPILGYLYSGFLLLCASSRLSDGLFLDAIHASLSQHGKVSPQ